MDKQMMILETIGTAPIAFAGASLLIKALGPIAGSIVEMGLSVYSMNENVLRFTDTAQPTKAQQAVVSSNPQNGDWEQALEPNDTWIGGRDENGKPKPHIGDDPRSPRNEGNSSVA